MATPLPILGATIDADGVATSGRAGRSMGDATLADATHVVLSSVQKSYGEIEAIRDASFALTAGEFVSVLGPSGCGFPCCARFPCVHAAATTPVQRLGVLFALLTQPCQPSPKGSSGRPAHSRGHQFVARFTEGFSHFVTSMTAPVASGWSVRRVGLAPTGKHRLLTAHT